MIAGSRRSFDDTIARLPETENKVRTTLDRLVPLLPTASPQLRVLEIGSAQGAGLIALTRLGHEAFGVEPWGPAVEVSWDVAASLGVSFQVVEGRAEKLEFESETFDIVLAYNVMEHVVDMESALNEIRRVLKPGGVFWFSSVSVLSPSNQHEIGSFPLFPYYPQPIKRRVMNWVMANRPDLVGHTHSPALTWWSPWGARRRLRAAGFVRVWDRWDLHTDSSSDSRVRQLFCRAAKRSRLVRLVGDVIASGCAYAGQRPLTGSGL